MLKVSKNGIILGDKTDFIITGLEFGLFFFAFSVAVKDGFSDILKRNGELKLK